MSMSALILRDASAIKSARSRLQGEGARLVLTNGVFDLLHVGHLRYLAAAAELGDALWVGLNSDRSVHALKGERRPLVPWEARAELLAALRPVQAVLFFDELTADGVLRLVQPDVYVKGGDYTLQTLPEASVARDVGAEIQLLPFAEGHSTSQMIETIVERFRADSS
jgi:D-glycero-beta-D-manno-heptose 1-phosphate adenylyltransferase